MDNTDKTKAGISRVARGESVDDVIHALLGEARMGDPGELERLYGSSFDHNERVSLHPDLEVPTLVRKHLNQHGFTFRDVEDPGTDYERHSYHNGKHEVAIALNPPSEPGSAPDMTWTHIHHGPNDVHSDIGGESLFKHLAKHF